MTADLERARAALLAIPPGLPRDEWHEIGRAAIAAGLTIDDVNAWSKPADNYKGRRDVESAFRTIKANGATTAGTLFHHAKLHGWIDAKRPHNGAKRAAAAPKPEGKAQHNPAAIWDACAPATAAHTYIASKLGLPDGLRVYGGSLTIAGQACDGALALPACTLAGELCTLQFIPIDGKKVFMPGVKLAPDACFIVGGTLDKAGRIFIVEGIGQAWSAHQATRAPAVVTFGAGRMAGVSRALREKYASADLVLVADRGKETQCAAIAADVRGQYVELPADKPKNYDLNDFHCDLRDLRAVAELLDHPRTPSKAPGRITPEIITARDLMATEFKPVSYLVDGLLPEGAYLLAGRPKIGKSWLALQIAVDVARGVDCMGRKTTQGDVLYLGLEDNKRRMQSRLRSLAPAADMPACFEAALWWHRLNDGGIDDLLTWAQRVKRPRLIVADTIAKLRAPKGRSDDPYAHDYAVGEALKKISDAFSGLTVLAVTHIRKAAADDVLDTISGTLGLTGAFDGAAVLDRKRGDAEGTLKIVGRDLEHDIELGVQWLAELTRWRIVGDAAEVKASAERRRILACLRDAKEPLLPREIAEETGLPRGSVRHLIRRMHAEGMVSRIEGPKRNHKYDVMK